MKTQLENIREYLERGGELTPLDALRQFGCLRLAARINDLRRDGLAIDTLASEAKGKRFAAYRLAGATGRRAAS